MFFDLQCTISCICTVLTACVFVAVACFWYRPTESNEQLMLTLAVNKWENRRILKRAVDGKWIKCSMKPVVKYNLNLKWVTYLQVNEGPDHPPIWNKWSEHRILGLNPSPPLKMKSPNSLEKFLDQYAHNQGLGKEEVSNNKYSCENSLYRTHCSTNRWILEKSKNHWECASTYDAWIFHKHTRCHAKFIHVLNQVIPVIGRIFLI